MDFSILKLGVEDKKKFYNCPLSRQRGKDEKALFVSSFSFSRGKWRAVLRGVSATQPNVTQRNVYLSQIDKKKEEVGRKEEKGRFCAATLFRLKGKTSRHDFDS